MPVVSERTPLTLFAPAPYPCTSPGVDTPLRDDRQPTYANESNTTSAAISGTR
ncbi:MAG: hypothetical protein WCS67_09525 [Bacteroidales bacterium]